MLRPLSAAIAALVLLGAAPAEAVVFTISAGGTITSSVDSGLFGPAGNDALVGQSWTVSVTFDTDLAGSISTDPPHATLITGAHPQGAFVSFTAAGITRSGYSGGAGFIAAVVDYFPVGLGYDAIQLQTGADPNQELSVFLLLSTTLQDALPSGELTQSFYYEPDVALDSTIGSVSVDGPDGSAGLELDVDWIAINRSAEVPAPGGVALLGLGLAALGLTRRRT